MTTKIPATTGTSAYTQINPSADARQVSVDVKKNEQGAYFAISSNMALLETYIAKPGENVVVELDPKFSWAYQTSPDGIKWWNQFTIYAHVGQAWRVNFVLDNQTSPEAFARWTKI